MANPLTKKIGPVPVWGWAALGLMGFVAWRYHEVNKQNAAGQASLAGAVASPSVTTSTTGGAGSFSTLADWEHAAIGQLTADGLDANGALNAITAWLNGNCVSADAYNGLASVITNQGLPPGYAGSQVPSLSVCSSSVLPSGAGSTAATSATSTTSSTTSAAPNYGVQPGQTYEPTNTPGVFVNPANGQTFGAPAGGGLGNATFISG